MDLGREFVVGVLHVQMYRRSLRKVYVLKNLYNLVKKQRYV
mgnify:CR=1 FL=1